jgi:hypothetical protein
VTTCNLVGALTRSTRCPCISSYPLGRRTGSGNSVRGGACRLPLRVGPEGGVGLGRQFKKKAPRPRGAWPATDAPRVKPPARPPNRSFPDLLFFGPIPRKTPFGVHIMPRKCSSSTDKHIYCTLSHVHLGYSVVIIMGSVTIFSRSIIQQQRLAYSFNTTGTQLY